MMAAYLEGRLDEAAAAAIEAWLADDPLARRIMAEAMVSPDEDTLSASAVTAAQNLVGARKSDAWFDLSWLRPTPALAGLACAAVIALVGAIELGSATQGAIVETDARVAAAVWSIEIPAREAL